MRRVHNFNILAEAKDKGVNPFIFRVRNINEQIPAFFCLGNL